jgi:hypothetical protein
MNEKQNQAQPSSQTRSFESRPFYKRVAFYPVAAAIVIGWLLNSILAGSAYAIASSNAASSNLAGLVLFFSILLALALIWFTYKFLSAALCSYAVAVGDGTVTLFVEPAFGRRQQMTVRSAEVDYLEHFTPADRESLICHLRNDRIVEIPLWALPDSRDLIINTLKSDQVKVLTI